MSGGIGKRHRRRGALGAALEAAHARAARLSASPPLLPRRSPSADVAERLRHATEVRELSRVGDASPPDVADARAREIWVVHADVSLMGGDHVLVASVREAADRAGAVVVASDHFVAPVLVDHALEAGADALALVARALADDELTTLAEAARARGLGVAVECHGEGEVDRAKAAGADAILVALFDRDRGRPDPAAASAVRARAAELGLNALDVLAHAPVKPGADGAASLDADSDPT